MRVATIVIKAPAATAATAYAADMAGLRPVLGDFGVEAAATQPVVSHMMLTAGAVN